MTQNENKCDSETIDSNLQNTWSAEDSVPWYAIRLFTMKQQEVADYFAEEGIETFVPMEYVDMEDKNGRLRHQLRPVVRNLIFVKKMVPEDTMRRIVTDSQLKMSVYKKCRESREYCEISAREMSEFRLMCNPEIAMKKYLDEGEAKLKVGTPVMVKYGPLKGLTGKLVRSSKKYYLLKQVPGMAVMLKVSRWCCKAIQVGTEGLCGCAGK